MTTTPSFNARNRTILIIGDATKNLSIAIGSLRQSGFTVVTSPDDATVMRQVRATRPDLILLDTSIEGPESAAACRRLKADPSVDRIPVLLITRRQSCNAIAALAAGGDDYVTTPLQPEELATRVDACIQMYALPRQQAGPDAGRARHEAAPRLQEHMAVRESGQHYRDFFDNVSDMLWLLSVKPHSRFQFIEVNPAAERLMALSHSEVVGRHVDEIVPHMPPSLEENLIHCMQDRTARNEEIELALPDGQHTFEVTLIPLSEGTAGQVCRIVCVARNITLRKRYETTLKQNAELALRLRRLTEIAPGIIGDYLLSADGQVTMPSASPRLEEITGWNCEDVMRDATLALRSIHSDDLDRHVASIQESARSLNAWHDEFRVHHPAKGEIWIEGRAIPDPEPDGGIRWHGFLHDVTERKRAEAQLSASERQLRTLAENLPILIVRYDSSGKRVYATPTFEQRCGVPVHEALGKTPLERPVIPEAANARLWKSLKTALKSGCAAEFEFAITVNDESSWQTMRVVPEFGLNEQVVGALAISWDITAHKKLEEALRALAKRREADIEEERRRIARELHDELGQQLVALRMNVALLGRPFGNDEPQLREAKDRTLALVDTLIQSARDVSASLRPTMLDMGLIPALEWLTARFTRHTGMRCYLQVPQSEVDMTDRQAIAIFRIVQESLTNAARHSKAARIDVALRCEPMTLVIEIKDNGIGFDVKNIGKSNTFGLVGIRERALAAGGEALVASEWKRGTVVRVRLPK